MRRKRNKILKKRIAGASASSVISISLVLLLVGLAAILALNANSIENYFKENIQVTAFLHQGTSEAKALKLQKSLEKEAFVKSTRYVSVEEGTKELVDMLGEDFTDVFVNSPIPSAIEILLHSEYFQSDSLDYVLNKLVEYPLIESATTQAAMVDSIGEVMAQVGLVLSLVVILLGFISVVLISNLIRLNIYASRFSIHTMQLVGASNSFIARPFLKRSALLGSLSGLLSCLIIAALFYYVHSIFPQIFELFQINILLEVALGLIVLGIIICLLCTRIVLGKVVKLDKDELYG